MDEKASLQSTQLDPRVIIDTYFRDNPYYKSQHQLDSFNEFITSDINGIQYIIKRENPLRIYKEQDKDENKYRYEISIYFGETIHPEKHEIESDKQNIFISSPIEYDKDNSKYMFPNIARLKGYTYSSSILCK